MEGPLTKSSLIWTANAMLVIEDYELYFTWGGVSGKEPTCQCRRQKRHRFNPWVWKIPWRRKWQPMTVFLPGKSHGQRSLAGFSPWGCKRVRHDLETKKQQESTMVGRRRERLLTGCHLRGWWDDVAVGNEVINHFYSRDGFVVCQTYFTFSWKHSG